MVKRVSHGCKGGGGLGVGVGVVLPGDGSTEDARLLFPCSHQPMKTLENGTFPSAKPSDMLTQRRARVNTKDKAMGLGGGGDGGC